MKQFKIFTLITLFLVPFFSHAEIVKALKCDVEDRVNLLEPGKQEIFQACKNDLEKFETTCINNIIQYQFDDVILIPVILDNIDEQNVNATPYKCNKSF